MDKFIISDKNETRKETVNAPAKAESSKISVNCGAYTYVVTFHSQEPSLYKNAYQEILKKTFADFRQGDEPNLLEFLKYRLAVNGYQAPVSVKKEGTDCRRKIGKDIRDLRERRGLGLRELAQNAEIDPANLSRIEQGKYSVTLDILSRIAESLGARVAIRSTRKSRFGLKRKIWFVPDVFTAPALPAVGAIDCIPENGRFPEDMHMGDVAYFSEGGCAGYFGVVAGRNLGINRLPEGDFWADQAHVAQGTRFIYFSFEDWPFTDELKLVIEKEARKLIEEDVHSVQEIVLDL